MSTRLELIGYLQELIGKRDSEGKCTSVTSLVGSLSQYKAFKEWLTNNVIGTNLTHKLRVFLLTEEDFFQYVPNTTFIGNRTLLKTIENQIPNQIVLKPKILSDLEDNQKMQSFDRDLHVFELILFLMNETKSGPILIGDLVRSIFQKCPQEFAIYKQFIGFKDKVISNVMSVLDLNFSEEEVLIQLISQLKSFLYYDSLDKTLTIAAPQEEEMIECLDKTGLVLLKKSLYMNLYRFGRRDCNQLQQWFETNHRILSEHMVVRKQLTLEEIIKFYPNVFIVKVMNINGWKNVIDLQPKCLGEKRWQQFELTYRYGIEIRGIEGIVTNVLEDYALIKSEIDFVLSDEKICPKFKVRREMIKIYGFQELENLRSFLHLDDRLFFDVKFMLNESDDELWSVTAIYQIKHSAFCFIQSIDSQWQQSSDCNWNQMPDSDETAYYSD